jgi:hypothetical protein
MKFSFKRVQKAEQKGHFMDNQAVPFSPPPATPQPAVASIATSIPVNVANTEIAKQANKNKIVCLTLEGIFAEYDLELEARYNKRFIILEESHKNQAEESHKREQDCKKQCDEKIKNLEAKIQCLEGTIKGIKIIFGESDKC